MNILRLNVSKNKSNGRITNGGAYSYGGYASSSSADLSNLDLSAFALKNEILWAKGEGDYSAVLKNNKLVTTNQGELAVGQYNNSNSGSTLFSVGNGTDENDRKNSFEVDSNGFISPSGYVKTLKTDSLSSSAITADTAKLNSISATTANLNAISSTTANLTNITGDYASLNNVDVDGSITSFSGNITNLLSSNLTVDYLNVTKSAIFNSLTIDEIKSVGGQIIISPANATLDFVVKLNDGDWKCYWKADDGDKKINNQFAINDLVVCQTFNAAEGTSYNISNTYYWRRCVTVSNKPETVDGIDYNWIILSHTDQDSYSNTDPKKDDKIAQLGNTSDATRQNAIVLSAYDNEFLDSAIKAPSIVQYAGIKTFALAPYRQNVLSNGKNEFRGDFKTSAGASIDQITEFYELKKIELTQEEYDALPNYDENVLYIIVSDDDKFTHYAYSTSEDGSENFSTQFFKGATFIGIKRDTSEEGSTNYKDYFWNAIKGDTLKDEVYFVVQKLQANSFVDKDKNERVQVKLKLTRFINGEPNAESWDDYTAELYQGDTLITGATYEDSAQQSKEYAVIDYRTTYDADKPQTYTVYVKTNIGKIIDTIPIQTQLLAGATFEVASSAITAAVQSSNKYTDGKNAVIVNQLNSLSSTSTSNTASITALETNLNDNYSTTKEMNSTIEQTARGITSQVKQVTEKLDSANLFGFSKGIIFWDNTLPDIQRYGFVANSSLGRIKNLGLNGENGDYAITFDAYTNYDGEFKVNFNLCDVNAKEGIQMLTTTIQHYELHYTLIDNEYIYPDKNSGYNGFFDCERVDANTNGIIYVSNLKIEKGALSTKFSIAPEDVENFNNGNLVSPTEWALNKLTKTDEKVEGYDVYVNSGNPTVSSPTIDYIYLNGVDIEDETPYTLSFWAKSDTEGAVITSQFYGNGGIINGDWGSVAGDGKTNTTLSTTWNKYYIHWYTCLSSVDSTSNTKYVLPLIISYDENNSVNGSAKFYIAGVKFEKGFVNDKSELPNSISSLIKQTADNIQLKVQNTGIDIQNNVIALSSKNTVITGDLTVSRLKTVPNKDAYVDINGSTFNIYGTNPTPSIGLGVDDNGNAYFIFYNENGTPMYNLGPNGIQTLIDSAVSASWTGKYFLYIQDMPSNGSSIVSIGNATASDNYNVYQYNAAYSIFQDGTRKYGSYSEYNGKNYQTGLDTNLQNSSYLNDKNNYIANGYYLQPTATTSDIKDGKSHWPSIVATDGNPVYIAPIYQATNGKMESTGANIYFRYGISSHSIGQHSVAVKVAYLTDKNGVQIRDYNVFPYVWSYGIITGPLPF